ncbi:MAG: hypothetical protein ACREX8_00510 [Gammaproteobacteria bacterium]
MDDTDPFAVVGRIDGHRLQITAATAQAAAAAAEYWRTDYPEATVDWFLRDDLAHDQPVLLLVRWRRGVPGIGETQRVVHAIPLVPGKAVDAHASAYCDTTLQLDLMEICNPGTGVPCEQCLRLAALHLDLTD